jgi:hypothetical protein
MMVLTVGCHPTTTRPDFLPVPEAAVAEVELFVREATLALALALDADSIPVSRTEAADGWLETGWFNATTLAPTNQRIIGPEVVKLRAFVDPGRANHSIVTIEIVYRPLADPSRPPRLLEHQVPADHPVALRVAGTVQRLLEEYGH